MCVSFLNIFKCFNSHCSSTVQFKQDAKEVIYMTVNYRGQYVRLKSQLHPTPYPHDSTLVHVPSYMEVKNNMMQNISFQYLSRLMTKPTICIGENKDADQLRGNREADQRLCFRYSDSTIPLLLKSEISSFYPFSVTVQPDLCQTCSETTLLVFPRGGSFHGYNVY